MIYLLLLKSEKWIFKWKFSIDVKTYKNNYYSVSILLTCFSLESQNAAIKWIDIEINIVWNARPINIQNND